MYIDDNHKEEDVGLQQIKNANLWGKIKKQKARAFPCTSKASLNSSLFMISEQAKGEI